MALENPDEQFTAPNGAGVSFTDPTFGLTLGQPPTLQTGRPEPELAQGDASVTLRGKRPEAGTTTAVSGNTVNKEID